MVVVGVTGAAGYIAGRLNPALARAGFDLRLIDDFSGPWKVERPELPVHRADLRDPESLRRLTDCDVILHLAAVPGVMACVEDPHGSAEINVAASERLFAFGQERAIAVAFASSFAVVGIPAHLPITEATPANPTHEYARQKADGERLLAAAVGRGRAGGAVLRMSNVYGRYQVGERPIVKGNVLNEFARQAEGGALRVNAPGTQRRDYIHLEDVVDHWVAVARFLARSPGAATMTMFNVASGEAASVLELADRVAAAWRVVRPSAAPLRIDVVPNPRGSIELLAPEFAVDRRRTEQLLGVPCRHSLAVEIPALLRGPAPAESPSAAHR
ncbi:MAG: NAD(P)-dependent oxidoreductase [Thermoplasmata archaeon]|nr:NAD(P)-dependent oxidoreductase [Thermoplasmata archaeon]